MYLSSSAPNQGTLCSLYWPVKLIRETTLETQLLNHPRIDVAQCSFLTKNAILKPDIEHLEQAVYMRLTYSRGL